MTAGDGAFGGGEALGAADDVSRVEAARLAVGAPADDARTVGRMPPAQRTLAGAGARVVLLLARVPVAPVAVVVRAALECRHRAARVALREKKRRGRRKRNRRGQ